jgi:hypothetical protein
LKVFIGTMRDVRILFLKSLDTCPVLISAIGAMPLLTLTTTGLILERNQPCIEDIQIWLLGATVRSFLRLILISVPYLYHIHPESKVLTAPIECLDVLGVIWFVLMALAVLPASACIYQIPITYAGCLYFMGGSFVFALTFLLIAASLVKNPPRLAEDQQYLLRRQRHASDDLPVDKADERVFWRDWLEKYGSFEIQIRQDLLEGRQRSDTDVTERRVSGGSADMEHDLQAVHGGVRYSSVVPGVDAGCTCAICLQPFESSSRAGDIGVISEAAGTASAHIHTSTPQELLEEGRIRELHSSAPEDDDSVIVRYPCAGQHYFHAHCLHSWLQANSTAVLERRRRRNVTLGRPGSAGSDCKESVTCPICRERPSKAAATLAAPNQLGLK